MKRPTRSPTRRLVNLIGKSTRLIDRALGAGEPKDSLSADLALLSARLEVALRAVGDALKGDGGLVFLACLADAEHELSRLEASKRARGPRRAFLARRRLA